MTARRTRRSRALAAALRAPRASELRKRLREGELSAASLCIMAEDGSLSLELMSEEERG